MIRRPPRSTLDRSSAASDVYKRQQFAWEFLTVSLKIPREKLWVTVYAEDDEAADIWSVSYTHLRAHETVLDLVCRLLLEKKTQKAT